LRELWLRSIENADSSRNSRHSRINGKHFPLKPEEPLLFIDIRTFGIRPRLSAIRLPHAPFAAFLLHHSYTLCIL
jgi:hypothetical protein